MNIVHATPLDFEGAKVEGLKALPFEGGAFAGAGTLESPELAAEPFDELVGSWSADVPKGASIALHAQAKVDGTWTAWQALGLWEGPGAGRSLNEPGDALGSVDVDTLKLKRPATALRYRVTMTQKGRKAPRLFRVAVALSSSGEKRSPHAFSPGPWVRELKVPPRSQAAEGERYKHDICSPTSLAMILEFWGKRLSTPKVADAVLDQRDPESKRYGNWPLNIAYASQLGLRGHVARLAGLPELERLVAAGIPVVASITFGEGELAGSPMKRTKGHLLVVSGFTPEGDVVTKDPAGPSKDEVRRVYRREQFERAWAVNKRGVAYVLGPELPVELVVGVPSADLRRKPRPGQAPFENDPELASQLIYGERVRALDAKGDWVEVEALEQEIRSSAKEWRPYRGWTPARALRWPQAAPADAVVRVKRAAVRPEGAAPLELPLGSRVTVLHWNGETARVRLPDGREAAARAAELRRHGEPADRRRILETARQLLGGPYVWGGRSAEGTDCSGLVSLSYRSEGVDLPRDAQEQFLRARPVKRSELKPGDLLFLSKPGKPKQINHVMLYAGSEQILESRQAAGKTLETTFRERFGSPLAELESGQLVTDLSAPKPERRALYFGAFLP